MNTNKIISKSRQLIFKYLLIISLSITVDKNILGDNSSEYEQLLYIIDGFAMDDLFRSDEEEKKYDEDLRKKINSINNAEEILFKIAEEYESKGSFKTNIGSAMRYLDKIDPKNISMLENKILNTIKDPNFYKVSKSNNMVLSYLDAISAHPGDKTEEIILKIFNTDDSILQYVATLTMFRCGEEKTIKELKKFILNKKNHKLYEEKYDRAKYVIKILEEKNKEKNLKNAKKPKHPNHKRGHGQKNDEDKKDKTDKRDSGDKKKDN